MKDKSLIEISYRENFKKVCSFINSHLNDVNESEDLAQEVWVRMMTSRQQLNAETIVPLLYTIARNLVTDHFRSRARRQNLETNLETTPSVANLAESNLAAGEIAKKEREAVKCLPSQRRIIYILSRYADKSVDAIATSLSLSRRTVENHLRLGRRDVRTVVAQIA